MKRLLETQRDINEFLFWVVCLQEEVLPKSIGSLQDSKGYCCLGVGVACTVETPELNTLGYISKEYPQHHPAPKWLIHINQDYNVKTGRSLVALNDGDNWTHKQIGDSLLEVYKDQLTL